MNNQIIQYIRNKPEWHLILSRYPNRYKELEELYKEENNQSFVSKLERISMVLSMMEMML